EEHVQIERVELREDALAERPQREDEQQVHDHGPDDLLQHRDRLTVAADLKEIAGDRRPVEKRHGEPPVYSRYAITTATDPADLSRTIATRTRSRVRRDRARER